MKKKILFLHSSSELYGSDKSLLNLVNKLDRTKYQIYVMLPSQGELVEKIEETGNCKVIIKSIAILRRKNLSIKGIVSYFRDFFSSVKYLKAFIKENNIDIIYTNTSVVFPGGVAAKSLNKKSIWHVREIISNKYENFIVKRIVNRYADVIIGNSKATLNSIIIDKNKGRVIYNVVDIKNDFLDSQRKNQTFTIGMAGRINRWKGQDFFVDAALEVLKEYPDVTFLIAGDVFKGEEYLKESLKEKISKSDGSKKIKLLGLISNMEEFYRSLDIFVLPSIKPEPFGLVILEAMARRVPVIATNFGGPAEIIQDEVTGILVEPKNVTELTQKIKMLIDDSEKREYIAKSGQIMQQEQFSIDEYIQNIEGVLDESNE
ncbi:glycosyltransferase family 4 protein [Enterococcus sp. DIV0242_7C1]|uniref:Glycosyl transferase family 1 domain-containing protein n=1 Tax=Candidatus Enterococcus dunnyi TaxID=1834192 RepID=A0AAQ3W446_9ENTE|nr:glycosyltransferase family 4 protein [Enterococcus sp. DIV0242_7C1]MBO0471099.1 glycosyltransferase family 4 protein [Enterococcus sp. DIV0242_7C1]